ncbi:MAG: hypothetical protein B7Z60_09350 [Ferrovum sp. 37-45-19]|nr:MAG: hypothetical protein B7Z60_09350 [Ferrovum sp. 37-45-19]HQT82371.1 hypothetical protein [Ferrovaceae bacterium]HQU07252.1 hypothetical protein [Ferrovaceae bacterium]
MITIENQVEATKEVINTTSSFQNNTDNLIPISALTAKLIRERISQLAVEAEVWEQGVYARSNDILYTLLQKSYELYKELTDPKDLNVRYKKQGLNDYLSLQGIVGLENKQLTQKIIRCIFGNKDRRRLSTYHTALRVMIKENWDTKDVPSLIMSRGGVQEISLTKSSNFLTNTDKAIAVKDSVLKQTIGVLSSDAISKITLPDNIGDQSVAVLTQEANGTYTVHCLVRNNSVVNAALASFYNANKEIIANNETKETVINPIKQTEILIKKSAEQVPQAA